MAPKIALILSGCGVFDGSEIHESVLALLALDREGVDVECLAPNINQHHVINHLTGEEMTPPRNVMVEAARIARGKIRDLALAKAAEFDAAILPGGFGAAKNLCTFAFQGAACEINPDVARFLREMHERRKPLGFICIAPAVAAKALGGGVELTIGNDEATADQLRKLGAKHVNHAVDEIHVDAVRRVVSTPAYMYHERISNVAKGIDALVAKVVELTR